MTNLSIGELVKRLIPYEKIDEAVLIDSLLASYQGSEPVPTNRASNPEQYGVFVGLEKTGYTATLEALMILKNFDSTNPLRRNISARVSDILKDIARRGNGDLKIPKSEYLNALYLADTCEGHGILYDEEAAQNLVFKKGTGIKIDDNTSKYLIDLMELAEKIYQKTQTSILSQKLSATVEPDLIAK